VGDAFNPERTLQEPVAEYGSFVLIKLRDFLVTSACLKWVRILLTKTAALLKYR
jgi:hypothetical protein